MLHVISNILKIPIAALLVRYLGRPLCSRRLPMSNYESLQSSDYDSFPASRLESKNPLLCGRVKLIKSILLSYQLFCNAYFLTPKGYIHEIQKCIWRFLQNAWDNSHSIHIVSWCIICRPKSLNDLGISPYCWSKCVLPHGHCRHFAVGKKSF